MPIFEFVCATCGNHFEKLSKSDATELPECPSCGSGDIRKLFSTFAATLGAGHSCAPGG